MGDQRTSLAAIQQPFRDAGFEVIPGVDADEFEVKKNHCIRLIRRNAQGQWLPEGPPYYLVRGQKCELEDRGYQKFWYSNGTRFPVRVVELKELQRFDQEVRALLNVKSLYHESLGTTSARSVYDRLEGRPG
jgi:hypothetical protein